MKAFLSHSSANKDYVETVAKELGRQFCVFDKYSFQSGVEFKDSIEKGLDDTNVFVLFASPESLASIWVEFEITEAFYRMLQKRLSRVLVLFMDDSLALEKLPNWLRRAKVVKVKSPKQAAREIRLHLNDLLRSQAQPLFIGRAAELAEAESALLSSATGSTPPRFLTLVGLPQIGRRSLAKRVAQNVLGTHTTTEFSIENGDDLRDLVFKLASEVEPYAGPTSLSHIQESISKLSDEAAAARGQECLRALFESGSLPMIVDRGGLVDENGNFSNCFRPLLRLLAGTNDVYVFFITSRKPLSTEPLESPIVRIPPLPPKETSKLLQGLASKERIKLSPGEISQLVDHISGYPPSCYFATQLIKTYGAPVILANATELVDFRVSAFVAYITKHTLSEKENAILRLLANYSPLPLAVIGEYVGLAAEATSNALIRLIDFSMAQPDKDGCYEISEPLKDAVYKRSEYFTKSETQSLAKLLNAWLTQNPEENVSLPFSRIVFRAATQAGDSSLAKKVVHIAADTFQVAEQAYNQQDYEVAVDWFRKVLVLRPGHDRATVLLVRSLAQLEEWTECETLCANLERARLPVRTTAFLRGFVERKRNRILNATTQFELARKAGRNDVAVLRELAWCYFISGNSKLAQELLTEAFETQPDNPFLIDMSIQVAMQLDDLPTAKKQLERLRIFETEAFYWHRMATFHARTGNVQSAVEAGNLAVEGISRPRFEALAHLVYCEIRLGKIKDARSHLAQIDGLYPRLRKTITFALSCHLELASGNADEVLRRVDTRMALSNHYFGKLRYSAIKAVLAKPGTSEARRVELQTELVAGSVNSNSEPRFEELPK